jgi:hypothetical protein
MTDLDPVSPARRYVGWRPTNASFYARVDAVRERAPAYRPRWVREEQRRTLELRGYNPDQPRVPRGGAGGGQWTSGAGVSDEISAARRGKGHHYMPRGVYAKRNLPPETRKVFEEATTGRLQHHRNNQYDESHRRYNEATDKAFDEYLRQRGITEEQMTPDHARDLLQNLLTSRDPSIRNHNMRMWFREILRTGPLRGRGSE